MNTEGGRIANLITSTRQCMAAEALAKARALGSGKACGALCGLPVGANVPLPSMVLDATVKICYSRYQTLEGCVPESVRIAAIQQRTLEESVNPLDPAARFSEFVRNFPAPCPPDPAWYANAGEPVLQLKNCPLPNKPDNPVLPG